MAIRHRRSAVIAAVALALGGALIVSPAAAADAESSLVDIPADLQAAVATGPVDVLVGFDATAATSEVESEPDLQVATDEAATDYAAQKVAALGAAEVTVSRSFDRLPVELVRVDSVEELQDLAQAQHVTALQLPTTYTALDAANLALIGQPEVVRAGFGGAGTTVAVVDSGLDYTNAAVQGAFGDCAGGPDSSTCRVGRVVDVTGTGRLDSDVNNHGTRIAGIVAQVAPQATIDAYGVFDATGSVTTDADVLAALNAVLADGPARGVRAVNISLGNSARIDAECTTSPYTQVFTSLRAAGILPVVAAGNSAELGGAYQPGVTSLACAPGAVRVGAVYPASTGPRTWGSGPCTDAQPVPDQIPCFSQGGSLLSIVAPGVDVTAVGRTRSGTSEATPHVAGAVAVLSSAAPGRSTEEIAAALSASGPALVDPRDGLVVHRLDLIAGAEALGARWNRPGTFTPLPSARIVDTRVGLSASGPVMAGQSVQIQVTGAGGVPTTGVSAIVANLTVTSPSASGNVSITPQADVGQKVSNLNYRSEQTVANSAMVPLDGDGRILLSNNGLGSVQLLLDVVGYYTSGTPTLPGAFQALTPSRIADSRAALGLATPLGPRQTAQLQVTGVGGVPVDGVGAVVATVTVTGPSRPGYLTVEQAGTAPPPTSNLNFLGGETVPNLVIVPVSASGQIALTNGSSGTTQVIVDIAGYFLAGTADHLGTYTALSPSRIADSRSGLGFTSRLSTGVPAVLAVAGAGGVPPRGAGAVVTNITVTDPTSWGYVQVYPADTQPPGISNLNYTARQTVPNLVTVQLADSGAIAIRPDGPGSPQVVVDAVGYFHD